MIELKTYSFTELASLMNCGSKQALERKLTRYDIGYSSEGNRAPNIWYTIDKIRKPFETYCILHLGFDAHTDFNKLRHFLYHFFCDDVYMSMPDEVKETWMRKYDRPISRQTISHYEQRLENLGYIHTLGNEFIYYFAYKGEQLFVDKDTYCQAWQDYWKAVNEGEISGIAINEMIANYGGVARKQAVKVANGIYLEEINYLMELTADSIEQSIQK